jgi:hypothetical protein
VEKENKLKAVLAEPALIMSTAKFPGSILAKARLASAFLSTS